MRYLISVLLFVFAFAANAECDTGNITITTEAQKHSAEVATAIKECDGQLVPFSKIDHQRFVGPFSTVTTTDIDGVSLFNDVVDVVHLQEIGDEEQNSFLALWGIAFMFLFGALVTYRRNMRWATIVTLSLAVYVLTVSMGAVVIPDVIIFIQLAIVGIVCDILAIFLNRRVPHWFCLVTTWILFVLSLVFAYFVG